MNVDDRLAELGLELPPALPAVASYVPAIEADNMLYVSGQVSIAADGTFITGRLGENMTVEEGQEAARRCALMILAQIREALGGVFGRVERIVRVGVYVNSAPSFTDQALVGNGASDLLEAVLGEAGRHTRSSVGVAVLPMGAAVEIDAIVQLR